MDRGQRKSMIKIEKRFYISKGQELYIILASIILALLSGALMLGLMGVNPWEAYGMMLKGSLSDFYGISETLAKTIPLAMCSLAVGLAFTMVVWNIGAEGQFVMGALACTAFVRYFYTDSAIVMLVSMAVVSSLAGGFWGAFAGFLKARWNVNEIITTLMMNYIAILLLQYFVYGSWRDPTSLGFPMTPVFPESARLPQFFASRVHAGLFFALIVALILWIVVRKGVWGYEIRVSGQNPRAADYAGIKSARNVILVMFLSGAIAGLAGMAEMAGLHRRLQPGFAVGYGYTAIIIAWLARLHPFTIIFVSFFFGALFVGGENLQIAMRLPLSTVQILQGLILFFLLGGEFFRSYRISLTFKKR